MTLRTLFFTVPGRFDDYSVHDDGPRNYVLAGAMYGRVGRFRSSADPYGVAIRMIRRFERRLVEGEGLLNLRYPDGSRWCALRPVAPGVWRIVGESDGVSRGLVSRTGEGFVWERGLRSGVKSTLPEAAWAAVAVGDDGWRTLPGENGDFPHKTLNVPRKTNTTVNCD